MESVRARTLIESRGAALMFLPPYLPDLNPIEVIFAKIKQTLRGLCCRTVPTPCNATQSVLDQAAPTDPANCFRHCGYTLHDG
jgi:hypothetical protein